MKNLLLGILLLGIISIMSCEEDGPTCDPGDNAVIDGSVCYYAFVTDYDQEYSFIGDERGDPIGEAVEIEWRGSGPTYVINIAPGSYFYDQEAQAWTDEPDFLRAGVELTDEASRTGISDVNSGRSLRTDRFTVVLTKVDRVNGLLSGEFTWEYSAFGPDTEVEAVTTGTFNDVPVVGLFENID